MQVKIGDDGIEVFEKGADHPLRTISLEALAADDDSGTAMLLMIALTQLAEMNARLGSVGQPDETGAQRMSGIQGATHATQKLLHLIAAGQTQVLAELKGIRTAFESLVSRPMPSPETATADAMAQAEGMVQRLLAGMKVT